MDQGLRLLAGALFVAVGTYTLAPAPAKSFFSASVIATEFSYCFVIAPLFLLWPGWRRSSAGRLGALLALASTALLATPVVRAMETGRALPSLLATSFGTEQRQRTEFAEAPRLVPFVLTELIRPVHSKPVRYEPRVVKNAAGRDLTVHIFRPGYPHPPIPGVIVVHGETWQSADGRELLALNGYLAARDFLVVSISDGMYPPRAFPDARDDVLSTIKYVKAHASEFGLDPTRLALLGRSIAGHLALLAAYTAHDPAIRGVIALHTPSDLQRWYESAPEAGVLDTRGMLNTYLGGPPESQRKAYEDASPISAVQTGAPATLLVHGMHDEVVPPDQSERLDARLQEKGVRHLFVRLPWATHGCDKVFAGPCGQITTYAVERFLNTVMKDGAVAQAPAPARRVRPQLAAARSR